MKKSVLVLFGLVLGSSLFAKPVISVEAITGFTSMQLLVRGGLAILIGIVLLISGAAAGIAILKYAGEKIRNFMRGGGGDFIRSSIGWGHGSGFWGMGSSHGSVKNGKLIPKVQTYYDKYRSDYLKITPRKAYHYAYRDYRYDRWSSRNRNHRFNYRYSQDY